MKTAFFCLFLLFVWPLAAAVAPVTVPGTNVMVITADGPWEYETNVTIFHNHVRATDALMNLTCELLTIYFTTNRPTGVTNTPDASANSQRIEMIVAETNVVIIQPDSRATGQKAVYTATNELFVLTGNPLVETQQGFLSCSNLFYDRIRNRMWGVGGIVMSNKPGMNLFGTSNLDFGLPGPKSPSRKAPATNP